MSTSVLRRYTPPTCTLEIAATGSVLSRWTDRTVLKNLRFQLSFDDPKLPPEQQITIRGDRVQLEALHEAVESYIQALLNQSLHQIHPLLIHPATPSQNASPRQSLDFETKHSNPQESRSDANDAGIYLKPRGLLAHELCLGALADQDFGSVIHLSTSQLFDLANALDEYHAEALTLPSLGRPAWLKSPASWARVAAVLLLSIGATGAVAKFVIDISSPVSQVASTPSATEESSVEEESPVSEPEIASSLPVPPAASSPSDLKLQPLFPPKPPAGAIRPETANPPVNESPPAPAAVPVDQLPAAQAQPLEVPSTAAPSEQGVVIVPDPDPSIPEANPEVNSSEAVASTPFDPLAEASTTTATIANNRVTSTAATSGNANQAETVDQSQVATNRNTAFDTFPQIAEVRNYFVENWRPPEELTQTLEYRLVLASDGTIQRIIPLGEASERFVDRTNMPLMGEPFVSPLEGREQLQVRLVLNADGKVQTFSDGN